MSEKGILFSEEMVRAILDGRKTQTRRIIKCQPPAGEAPFYIANPPRTFAAKYLAVRSPFFVGDRMYVRETWGFDEAGDTQYRATYFPAGNGSPSDGSDVKRWHPSIHMPKEAARIWLNVTHVRVERLQDISEDDAAAEGVSTAGLYPVSAEFGSNIHRHAFSRLWDSCYGSGAWKKNPWVWVIMFKKIEEEK